jgi:hypothetical protein
VLLVREHLVLQRQERAAGIDEVDAGQAVFERDFLRAQMLLHRHREIRAALDGRVVGDDEDFAAMHAADAGDDAGAGRGIVVHAVRGERRQFEERRTRIEQGADAFARQQLAAFGVLRAGFFAAALRGLGDFRAPFVGGGPELRGVGEEVRRAGIDLRGKDGHVNAPPGRIRSRSERA